VSEPGDPTDEQIIAHLSGEKPPPAKRIVRRVVPLLELADPHLMMLNNAIQALRREAPDVSGPLAKMRLRLYDSIRGDDPQTAQSWVANLEKGARDIQDEWRQEYVAALMTIKKLVGDAIMEQSE